LNNSGANEAFPFYLKQTPTSSNDSSERLSSAGLPQAAASEAVALLLCHQLQRPAPGADRRGESRNQGPG